MKYYNPILDDMGNTHSIDMIYIEYFSYINPKGIIDIIRNIHEKYIELKYVEHLDRSPHSKYDYYLDGVLIGGVYISCGKYNNYDKLTKTFDLLPMFEIRLNPNKYFNEIWFQELLNELLKISSSGVLRKYDYAVDIPTEQKNVKVFNSKKEVGIYKGTCYYGQSGRHGYLKVYDKQKDMKRQKVEIDVLTRIEHTLFDSKQPSLEEIYIFDDKGLKEDFKKLNDTDKAIVEMFLQLKCLGYEYNLKLGRGKKEKLLPYIQGSYKKLEYGNILERLIENIKEVFKVDVSKNNSDLPTDENGYLIVSADMLEELPF